MNYSDNRAGGLAVMLFHSTEPPPFPTDTDTTPIKIHTRRDPLYHELEINSGIARALIKLHIASGREVQIHNRAGDCVFHSKDRDLLYPKGDAAVAERFDAFWSSLP